MHEAILLIQNEFKNQNNLEQFLNILEKYLNSLFSLEDDFSISSFNSVFTVLCNEDFAKSLYNCLISYDDDDLMATLQAMEDITAAESLRDLIFVFGPKLEKHFLKQMQPYSMRVSDISHRKIHGQYEIGLEISNYANQSILIFDNPNNILLLVSRLLSEINEYIEYFDLDEELLSRIKIQMKKL